MVLKKKKTPTFQLAFLNKNKTKIKGTLFRKGSNTFGSVMLTSPTTEICLSALAVPLCGNLYLCMHMHVCSIACI